ncbi:MAG: ribonuclease HII [Thaumarchaeota archaeon]|nr:ribonuclease HII [Candidatus Calditenuaceae archaeon]MDW8187542.1 ribonuclease HII [Nitrososphaerota archaeon]
MKGPLVAGIDEAGRGSVLGPMVIALFALEGDRVRELEELGVKDSKTLTPSVRERLYDRLRSMGALIRTKRINPTHIDRCSKSRGGCGLNELELKAMRELISGVRPHAVYIDSPYRNTRKASELIGPIGGVKIHFKVRADASIAVVAAASIVAKVLRDRAIRELGDVGSGYPSDPKTRSHLERLVTCGHLPNYVRRSWRTVGSFQRLDVYLDER